MIDRKIYQCSCGTQDHQTAFMFDEQFLIITPLLSTDGFFKRLLIGIKYIFGKKSDFGYFDEIILQPDQITDLVEFIEKGMD